MFLSPNSNVTDKPPFQTHDFEFFFQLTFWKKIVYCLSAGSQTTCRPDPAQHKRFLFNWMTTVKIESICKIRQCDIINNNQLTHFHVLFYHQKILIASIKLIVTVFKSIALLVRSHVHCDPCSCFYLTVSCFVSTTTLYLINIFD